VSGACRRTVWVLLIAAAAGGCASRESVYEDIRRNRTASFERWQAAHENRDEAETDEVLRGKLGIAESVQIALGNNKQLRAILEEKEKSTGRIVEAMSYALPTVTVNGTYEKTDKVPTITFGPMQGAEGLPPLGRKDNWAYGVTFRQPVYTGGASTAAIRGAKIFQYLADERIRTTAQNVIASARRAYYDVLLQRVLQEVAETSLKVSEEHVVEVKKRRRNGVASDFDVLRAEVEVSNFDAIAIEAKNRAHLAETSFFKVLGISQESHVEFVDALEFHPADVKLVDVVEKALAHRPDLYEAELDVKLQRESIKVARSGWLPKVFLFADWESSKPSRVSMGNLGWDEEWSGGVRTEIPIFDGLKTLGRVIQEKATLRQKKTALRDTEERALLEARQAYLTIRDSEEFVESQQASLDTATEASRLAQVSYRNGVATQVEVLDAQEALTRARGNYYRAVHVHMVAKLELERATGALAPKSADGLIEANKVRKAREAGRPKPKKKDKQKSQ